MIPGDVQNSLKTLAQPQKPLITATAQPAALAAFEPGQRYQATVMAQLAPGIFKVNVANQSLQLQLPANIKSGDTITLQVVSLLPRLTFNMAASANPLSTADQLSETARLLSALSQQPLQKGYVNPIRSAPLWTGGGPFPDAGEFARKLHDALSHSGLFYEAHQAQWVAGRRSQTQLMQEPQNHAPDETSRTFHEAFHHGEQAKTTFPGIPEHLVPVVQQQLQALETRQVHWQGEIWPEQEMQWKIREEDAPPGQGYDGRQWMTELELDLPQLGKIKAQLRFAANGISLQLDAGTQQTRDKLGAASSALVSAMSERGIHVVSAKVTRNDEP